MTTCKNGCLVVVAIVLLMHSPTLAASLTGRVSRVVDGDTVVLAHGRQVGGPSSPSGYVATGRRSAGGGVRVRLADIDAEHQRSLRDHGARQAPKTRLVRVRLAEIDAPEIEQAYGPEAKAALVDMIGGKLVVVSYTRKGRYGRILGTITVGECDINVAMVQAGHAWRYRYARKTGAVAEAELAARREGVGLWAADGVTAPWVWRKGGE